MALEMPNGLWSYQDYAAANDGLRYQVIDGIPVLTPAPSRRHQQVLRRLVFALERHLEAHPQGELMFAPFDVVLEPARPAVVLQPDLFFVSLERLDILTPANVQGAPDLVVEVLSPSTAMIDLNRKKSLYASNGVLEYWVVWPDEARVHLFRLVAGDSYGEPGEFCADAVLSSQVLPGLELAIAPLFAGLNASDGEVVW